MSSTVEREVLSLWERAAALPALARDDALLGQPPPLALGERNARLLQLRARLFGGSMALHSRCPQCDATAEFAIDCDGLSLDLLPRKTEIEELECDGWRVRFRVPDAADLRAASGAADDEAFARELLRRCVLASEAPADGAADWPESVAEALSQRMEALDPGAHVRFDLQCPECGAVWSAPMDVGAVLWSELQSRAERVLLDVDVLARAYGWTEAEVLSLSPTRRAAYLQLAGTLA